MKKLFILSSKSGKGSFESLEGEILKYYPKDSIVYTQGPNHAKDIANTFKKNKGDLLIVCGGDGVLSEVAEELAGSKTALGLIPMGTGNDFSKNFSYKNFTIDQTLHPIIMPIDLMEINGRIGINVMSMGFDTEVLVHAYKIKEKFPFLGKLSFLYGVFQSLRSLEYMDLSLEITLKNNERIHIENKFLISALCNGSYYGSGFQPAPDAILDDGFLNLVMAKPLGLGKILSLFMAYRKGTHLKQKKVKEYLVRSGRISSNKEIIYNIDGEIYYAKDLTFQILDKSLLWARFDSSTQPSS